MSELPNISIRFYLSLAEAQEGFKMAVQPARSKSRWVIQGLCVLIMLWGVWLGAVGGGMYFIILGGGFLLLQLLMQYIVLPKLFARQYNKQKIGATLQGIELTVAMVRLWYADEQQQFALADVAQVQKGQQVYVLRFESGMLSIVPQRALKDVQQVDAFEQLFNLA